MQMLHINLIPQTSGMAKVFVRDLKPLAWNGKETGDRNVTHLQFDPLGDYCALMRIDGSLSIWNMASLPTEIIHLPPPLKSLEISPHSLVNMAWSEDSSLLASTILLPDELGGGTYITVWDLRASFPITQPLLALRSTFPPRLSN
jgi:WD40 repeat protein